MKFDYCVSEILYNFILRFFTTISLKKNYALFFTKEKTTPQQTTKTNIHTKKKTKKPKTMRYQLLKRPVKLPDDFNMLAV